MGCGEGNLDGVELSGGGRDAGEMRAPAGASAISFGFPRIYRGALIFLLVACFGFIGFSAGVAMDEPGMRSFVVAAGGVALFGSGAIISAIYWSRSRDRISVDDDGIAYVPHRGPATFIGWGEVGKVEAHYLIRRLVVQDRMGLRRINLGYHLEDFSRLREIVRKRTANRPGRPAPIESYRERQGSPVSARAMTPSAMAPTARPAVFHAELRTWVVVMSPLAVGVVYGLIVLWTHQSLGPDRTRVLILYFVILAAAELILIARLPWRIMLSDSAASVGYPLWNRVVPYRAITRIELLRGLNREGRRLETVRMELKNGRALSFRNLKSGERTLYEVLMARWGRDL